MPTDRPMRCITSHMKKGGGTGAVDKELEASQRHVQQLWAEYLKTGEAHVQDRAGRPKKPSGGWVYLVPDTRRWPDGVQLAVGRLRRARCDVWYARAYAILKSYDLATASPAKSRQREGARYERVYSNAMWHTDWHAMKDSRMKGLNLITYLDDASRCVTEAEPFREAASENAVAALRRAVGRFGAPATIPSDNGCCLAGSGRRKKPSGSWTPTLFEAELLSIDIGLINSRPYRPRTNGKPGRFYRSVEDVVWRYNCPDDCTEYCNTDRLHWALDVDNYETPLMAFRNKAATDNVVRRDPEWNGGGHQWLTHREALHDFHTMQQNPSSHILIS